MTGWPGFAFGLLWAPFWTCGGCALGRAITKRWPPLSLALARWMGVAAVLGVANACTGYLAGSAGEVISLAVALAIWWYRRKKRRSVAALIGDKSRRVKAAIVARMRQSARPSPVLRPSLGGAR